MRASPILVVLAMAMQGCVQLTEVESAIAGEWSWDLRDESQNYFYHGSINLRRDGKFSRSSEFEYEGAGLADDSFGHHRFGWLVRGDSICFVDSRNARISREVDDSESRCTWKVREESAGTWSVLMWDRFLEQHVPLARID